MKWTKGSVPPLDPLQAGMWMSTRPAVTLDDLPDLLRSLGVVVTMDEDLGLIALLRPPEPEENAPTPKPRGNLRRC